MLADFGNAEISPISLNASISKTLTNKQHSRCSKKSQDFGHLLFSLRYMILQSLQASERTETLHPLLKQLFDYVKSHDLTQVPAGRITLDGEKLFINVADATLVEAENQKLEVHRCYIDVHFPLSGAETVGWSALGNLECESEKPFDAENDFALYNTPADVYFTAQPGQFYVMFPEDAHAPIIGQGKLRKAIAKVLLPE